MVIYIKKQKMKVLHLGSNERKNQKKKLNKIETGFAEGN